MIINLHKAYYGILQLTNKIIEVVATLLYKDSVINRAEQLKLLRATFDDKMSYKAGITD